MKLPVIAHMAPGVSCPTCARGNTDAITPHHGTIEIGAFSDFNARKERSSFTSSTCIAACVKSRAVHPLKREEWRLEPGDVAD